MAFQAFKNFFYTLETSIENLIEKREKAGWQ